jgi:hypothetical protein
MDRLHVCPADGRTCEVVHATDLGYLKLLPCMRCRVMERAASELRGARVGKHERRLLLAAASPSPRATWPYEGEGTPVRPIPPQSGFESVPALRSAEENTRQAMRRLREKGLLWVRSPLRVSAGQRSLAWRTPLGEHVARAYDKELRNGAPIRWHTHLPAIEAATRLTSQQLRRIYEEKLDRLDSRNPTLREIANMLYARNSGETLLVATYIAGAATTSMDELDNRFLQRIAAEWITDDAPNRASIGVEALRTRRELRRRRQRRRQT